MGRKDDKRWRREKQQVFSFQDLPPSDIESEKQKARELRASPWWRRKIASGECHYCHNNFNPAELTMDHVIPLSRGGKSEKINIAACCKECNNKKKYLLPAEWDEYLQGINNGASSAENEDSEH
jgi:5-methylcytosine-specific restriction enzyme A